MLISRAKRRCEVFASITDEDIDLERAKGKGVFAFKLFLQYARTGRISIAQRSEREMDSVFEEQVANALQKAGYQVHPQVGIASALSVMAAHIIHLVLPASVIAYAKPCLKIMDGLSIGFGVLTGSIVLRNSWNAHFRPSNRQKEKFLNELSKCNEVPVPCL